MHCDAGESVRSPGHASMSFWNPQKERLSPATQQQRTQMLNSKTDREVEYTFLQRYINGQDANEKLFNITSS